MANNKIDVEQSLETGNLTSKQLQSATGLSQPAISRQLQLIGNRVVKLPNGRQPKYALTRNAFGSGNRLPLFVIDANGSSTIAAHIRPLLAGGFFVELCPEGSPLLLGHDSSGVFDDLPYYLQDLRPEGFVGRQIAQELATRTGAFPKNPTRWNTNQTGRYLLSNGDDLPGDFQLGEAGLLRIRRAPFAYSLDDYPNIADSVLAGELTGSSAGGEQPKFTVYSREKSAHVIVKFSPSGNTALARRWRDILITEFHATEVLRTASVLTAKTELVEKGGRLFLKSERFDRSGQYGRSSMISMQMVDAEFVGDGADWPIVMKQLVEQQLISAEHARDSYILWEFGYLINNTDMHLGNLSLSMDKSVFSILPSYDMCSMGFAPVRGEVKPFSFALQSCHSKLNCLKDSELTQTKVRAMAVDFWERVTLDKRTSDEFREFLSLGNPVN